MKRIKDVLFTILIIIIICSIYMNREEIVLSFQKYLMTKNKIVLQDTNIYTRNFKYKNFSYDEDYIPENIDDIKNIYYNVVNNGWIDFTFYCPTEYENCLKDVSTIANDEELLSNINNYIHPFNSFTNVNTEISSNGYIHIQITRKYTDETIVQVNNVVNQLIAQLKLEGKTDEEKISIIHDYIISNTEYDTLGTENTPYQSSTAYGTLIEHYSICSGYADTMAIFLDKINIPNLKVSSSNHVWNLVYIENKWLHLDLTWDDTKNPKYKSNYYLINTERLFELDKKEHTFDQDFYVESKNLE